MTWLFVWHVHIPSMKTLSVLTGNLLSHNKLTKRIHVFLHEILMLKKMMVSIYKNIYIRAKKITQTFVAVLCIPIV